MTSMLESRVLLRDLVYVESARWHDGRLWFAHWGTGEVVAVDMDGNGEVVGHGPDKRLGWSIDWLPDGSLLVTGDRLMRQQPDGSMVPHVDLSGVAEHGWNEMVVDGRGNIYVNGFDFDFLGGEKPKPGIIALVAPNGKARQVAGGIDFPNGMVISPDNSTLIIAESFAGRLSAFDVAADGSLSNRRTWADGLGPDGICLDAEGAIWSQAGDTRTHTGKAEDPEGAVVRVTKGGEITHRVELDRACFSCALGGRDGRTLFLLAADWRGPDRVDEALVARTGQVLITRVPVPGVQFAN